MPQCSMRIRTSFSPGLLRSNSHGAREQSADWAAYPRTFMCRFLSSRGPKVGPRRICARPSLQLAFVDATSCAADLPGASTLCRFSLDAGGSLVKVAELILPSAASKGPEFSLRHSDKSCRGFLTPAVCLLVREQGKMLDRPTVPKVNPRCWLHSMLGGGPTERRVDPSSEHPTAFSAKTRPASRRPPVRAYLQRWRRNDSIVTQPRQAGVVITCSCPPAPNRDVSASPASLAAHCLLRSISRSPGLGRG